MKKTVVVSKTPSVLAQEEKSKIFEIHNDNRGRGNKFVWDVFPDYWKENWGELPRLGTVRADSEFDAVRAAYDKGLLTMNFTFGPKVVKRSVRKMATPVKLKTQAHA